MALEYYQAEVYNIIQETPSVRRFQLRFNDLDVFDFKAGQYVKVDMPLNSTKNYRQYSISSEPVGNNEIELLIVFKEGGDGTDYMFNKVKVGSVIPVSRALGRFVLPEHLDKDICFICTGVGLAPFRAMYLDVLNKNIPFKNMHLIFGTRHIEDICYADELFGLDKLSNNFHYHPVLSREQSAEWTGKKGYVHPIYKELFADKQDAIFYLCGWDEMIKEARHNLLEIGYTRRDILFEKYD
jgi:CDP-4-dehydro-6-deoxyglucose reductase